MLFGRRSFHLEDCIAFFGVGLDSFFSEVESKKKSALTPKVHFIGLNHILYCHTQAKMSSEWVSS